LKLGPTPWKKLETRADPLEKSLKLGPTPWARADPLETPWKGRPPGRERRFETIHLLEETVA
jgi:hypothetical protein